MLTKKKKNTFSKVKEMLLFFTLIFINIPLFSQYYRSDDYGGLAGGVYGGFSFSQINGDGYRGYDKFGYTGGGTLFLPMKNADLPFPGTLAWSLDVSFIQMGAFGNDMVGSVQGQKINLTYAQVPFQLFYYQGTRKSNIGMGFAVGYLGWQEHLVDRGFGYELQNVDMYKKFDIGFVFTPNIHLYKGLFLSPRYYYSFMNVAKYKGLIGSTHQFNNSVSLRLLYMFSGSGN